MSSQEWAPTSAAPAGRPPPGARPAGGCSHLHRAAAALARSLRRQDPPGHSGAATVRVAARVLTNPPGRGGRRERGGWGQSDCRRPGRARAAQIWAPSTLPHASAAGGRHGSATAHAVHAISTSPRADGRPPRSRRSSAPSSSARAHERGLRRRRPPVRALPAGILRRRRGEGGEGGEPGRRLGFRLPSRPWERRGGSRGEGLTALKTNKDE